MFALAFFAGDRRLRVALVVCALLATTAAGAFAAREIEGRSAKDVTSGRSRLVAITLDAFELRPVAGVGIGGQPQASADASGRRSPNRNASHTTPLTVLAELGILGFGLYLWMLGAVGWALVLVTRQDRAFGLGLAAVLLILFVHSLLYAGFFEDPLTWGVFGLAAAGIASGTAARAPESVPAEPAKTLRSCWHTDSRPLGRPSLSCQEPSDGSSLRFPCSLSVSAPSCSRSASPQSDPKGALDTELADVTVSTPTKPPPKPSLQASLPSRSRTSTAGVRSGPTRSGRSRERMPPSGCRKRRRSGRGECAVTSSSRRPTARATST